MDHSEKLEELQIEKLEREAADYEKAHEREHETCFERDLRDLRNWHPFGDS